MSTLARQVLSASRKRKEPSEGFKPPPKRARAESPEPSPKPSPLRRSEPAPLPAKNRLLAGYLAHEFLTKGTLFGQPFNSGSAKSEPIDQPNPSSYADVAHLMKSEGTHIPGIVNPTQLGSWIQRGGAP